MLQPYRSNSMAECPECEGEGQMEYEVTYYGGGPGAYSPFRDVLMACQTCEGIGEVFSNEEEIYDD